MKYPILFLLALLMAFPATTQAQQNADDVLGYWIPGDDNARMYIYKQNGEYYGKLTELKQPNNPDGTPKRDVNNPDEEKRDRLMDGLVIMRGFEYDGDWEWEDGNIYDPRSGNDYSCEMWLEDRNTLKVRGYLGVSLLGRTETFIRDTNR